MLRNLAFPIIAALIWVNPACAQNNIDSTPIVPCVKVIDATGEHTFVAAPVKAKVPFAIRHPKLHRAGRRIRRFCQVTAPVVQFGGNCAQIVRLFY